MKTWIASIATVAATVGIIPGQARADHLSDIDQLACLLRDQAAEACYEIRYHFSGAPNYRHLYADTYELYRQADRIHDLVHGRAPLAEVVASVDELDDLFHHVEEVVQEVETCDWARGICRGNGYHHTSYGRSRFSSYHFRRLETKIAAVGDTIHALGDEVTAVRGPAPGRVIEPPLPPEALPGLAPSVQPTYRPVVPVRPSGPGFPSASRRSIQFGNGSVRFSLNLGR